MQCEGGRVNLASRARLIRPDLKMQLSTAYDRLLRTSDDFQLSNYPGSVPHVPSSTLNGRP